MGLVIRFPDIWRNVHHQKPDMEATVIILPMIRVGWEAKPQKASTAVRTESK